MVEVFLMIISLTWSMAVGCDSLNATTGFILSGQLGTVTQTTCTYNITAAEGVSQVTLDVIYHSLKSPGTIKVYDGTVTSVAPSISLNESSLPDFYGSVTSTNDVLTVVIEGQPDTVKAVLSYHPTNQSSFQPTPCGAELTAGVAMAVLSTPNVAQRNCNYRITAPKGSQIELFFEAFYVETGEDNCFKQYMALYDGESSTSNLIYFYCNREKVPDLISTTNEINIESRLIKGEGMFVASYRILISILPPPPPSTTTTPVEVATTKPTGATSIGTTTTTTVPTAIPPPLPTPPTTTSATTTTTTSAQVTTAKPTEATPTGTTTTTTTSTSISREILTMGRLSWILTGISVAFHS